MYQENHSCAYKLSNSENVNNEYMLFVSEIMIKLKYCTVYSLFETIGQDIEMNKRYIDKERKIMMAKIGERNINKCF